MLQATRLLDLVNPCGLVLNHPIVGTQEETIMGFTSVQLYQLSLQELPPIPHKRVASRQPAKSDQI